MSETLSRMGCASFVMPGGGGVKERASDGL